MEYRLTTAPQSIRGCLSWSNSMSQSKVKETLQLERIDEKAKRCKYVDILVFYTGQWWIQEEPYNG